MQRGITPAGAAIDRPTSEPSPTLSRSQTVPPPRNQVDDIDRPRGGLARSKTMLPVAENARERTNPSSPTGGESRSPGAQGMPQAGLQRSMTMSTVRPTPGMTLGPAPLGSGMTRGLSVRKSPMAPMTPSQAPPPPEKGEHD